MNNLLNSSQICKYKLIRIKKDYIENNWICKFLKKTIKLIMVSPNLNSLFVINNNHNLLIEMISFQSLVSHNLSRVGGLNNNNHNRT